MKWINIILIGLLMILAFIIGIYIARALFMYIAYLFINFIMFWVIFL